VAVQKYLKKSEKKACQPSACCVKRESGATNRPQSPVQNILKKVKKKLVSLRHVALNGNLARQIGCPSRSKIFQKK
jgi:hypothetical protein